MSGLPVFIMVLLGADVGVRRGEMIALRQLRHSFCSRWAMRSAPTKSIQELAGHSHYDQIRADAPAERVVRE